MNEIIKEEDIKLAEKISQICTFSTDDRKAYICLNNHFAANSEYEQEYNRHFSNYFIRNFKALQNGCYKKIPFSDLHKQITLAIHRGEEISPSVVSENYTQPAPIQSIKALISSLKK